MSGLFNEEPTAVVRRVPESAPAPQSDPLVPSIDLDGSERLIENLAIYGSPLLNAATELLAILVTLSRQGVPRDVDRFRQQILDGVANFKRRGLYLDYHPSVIDKSCFVLCAAFDEAILYTQWGDEARWENHTLLSKVFSQRNGGEVFFVLLEKASLQPTKLIDFIELQYVLLMMGFQGRYRDGDETALHQVKADVYAIIRYYRHESPLPVPKTPDLIESSQPRHWLSSKMIFMTMLIALGLGYLASEYWYHNRSEALLTAFHKLDLSDVDMQVGSRDLVYLSDDADIGIVSEETLQQTPQDESKVQSWEILLATLTRSEDVSRLAKEIERAGYDTFSRQTSNGYELLMKSSDALSRVKTIKNELNVRFGLNATIRRASE
ncbi:type IVB secretion system protein IcmH/DotU [Thaumasiovibrio subtropicus]|uniref:type IVB secretion system protein IcmH/DotU n=1 Tax=Thaumasiovibrio subtropicus TaxID=1891207 RepID=UPI000B35636A|nr:type IVB secretion system protein IcmH/DotU [Thaumasiovibrio subtropicus]